MNDMIPHIIHQIWIGNLPRPQRMMETWREKHPDFEYRVWTDTDIIESEDTWTCMKQIQLCREFCGVADIMRLEILWKYGGIFIDADSVCIEPLDKNITEKYSGFAAFEHETARPGLIANGVIGFCKEHPLVGDMLQEIRSGSLDIDIPQFQSWKVLGPAFITRYLNTGKYKDVAIFPSYYFFPEHHTKLTDSIYSGHKKVYAHQLWGTSNQSYEEISTQEISLPCELIEPVGKENWVSVLITSYNTPSCYLRECLDSIRNQQGHFGIEIVWVNDGSNKEYSDVLEAELTRFSETSRFCKIVYLRTDENRGVAHAANDGLKLCKYDLVFKMDADDIMLPTRILTQMKYMQDHPECQICGSQIKMFRSEFNKQVYAETAHPERVSWIYLQKTHSKWFANHPTLCFRKSALLEIGGYSTDTSLRVIHDYEMLVRWMHISGNELHNLKESLLLYRLHNKQLTFGLDDTEDTEKLRKKILQRYIV